MGALFLGPLREKKFLFRGIFVQVLRYVKNVLQTGISLHRDPAGEHGWSSFVGTFERKGKVYLGSFLGPRGH